MNGKTFITTYFIVCTLVLASMACNTYASTLAEFSFADPAQDRAFRELTEQLRCLVCQNESLAASQAELAQDLRREIYAMMQAGQSPAQIVDFLVARYGDFVLYSPPLKPATYLLWYGPFLLFGLAGFFLVRALMRQQRKQEVELSTEEATRLVNIMDNQHIPQDSVK